MISKRVKTIVISLLAIIIITLLSFLTIKFRYKNILKDHTINEELKPIFDNSNNTIPIAFASDNNYVKYLSVAIISLTDNMSKDYNYDIVILEDKIKDKSKLLLLEQVKDFKNVSLRFIDINKYFDEYKYIDFHTRDYITRSTYNRLFIPNIFNKYDKVLYLDVDILINDNLVDLYNTELGNNMIVGVNDLLTGTWVPNEIMSSTYKDTIYEHFSNYIKQKLKKDPKEYINAGVLLFDIKNCLENNFTNLCLKVLEDTKGLFYQDQDLINIVCKGKIKYLDYRYNFFPQILDLKDIKKYIPEYILNDIRIFHFAGNKPWSIYGFNYEPTPKWFKVSKRSPFFKYDKKEILKLKLSLIRYKISKLIFRSEKRLNKYKTKIEIIERKIEFIEKQLI